MRNFNAILWETRTILKNLFWGVVDAVTYTADVYVTVRPLVVSRNKALMGSIDKAVKVFEIDNF